MQLFLNAFASLQSKSSRLIPKTDTQNVTFVCSNFTPKNSYEKTFTSNAGLLKKRKD